MLKQDYHRLSPAMTKQVSVYVWVSECRKEMPIGRIFFAPIHCVETGQKGTNIPRPTHFSICIAADTHSLNPHWQSPHLCFVFFFYFPACIRSLLYLPFVNPPSDPSQGASLYFYYYYCHHQNKMLHLLPFFLLSRTQRYNSKNKKRGQREREGRGEWEKNSWVKGERRNEKKERSERVGR